MRVGTLQPALPLQPQPSPFASQSLGFLVLKMESNRACLRRCVESKLKLLKWSAWVLVHGRVSAHMLTLTAMSVSSESRPGCPQGTETGCSCGSSPSLHVPHSGRQSPSSPWSSSWSGLGVREAVSSLILQAPLPVAPARLHLPLLPAALHQRIA